MADGRRILEKADVEIIVGIIRSFRKKPTWKTIVARSQGKGLPFQLRAIQRQPKIKSAYQKKVAEVRADAGSLAIQRRDRTSLPSKGKLRELILDYETRIETLEQQNERLLEQLNWLRQRCRRENIEVAEINRPLVLSARS